MSVATVASRALAGIHAPEVRVEVHLGPGLPAFHIVGLPDAEVREARDRAKQIEDQAARRSNEAIEAAKQSAQTEGARIVAAAREEAATETGRAREELRKEFGSMVVVGASRLLEREVDAKTHAQLLDKLAEEIARG